MIVKSIVLGLFMIDMFMSYSYLEKYQERFPKNDWTLAEGNFIIRFFLKKYGLDMGMMMGSVVVVCILLGSLLIIDNILYEFFLIGLYYSTNMHHVANWLALRRLMNATRENKKNN